MSSYLLYETKHALHTFTVTTELQFHVFNPRGKIIQNVSFSPVSQNSNLSSKLNIIHPHESMCILYFQNKASDIKLLKFHANQDNSIYLKKCDFQRKLVCQFRDNHWICGIKMSPKMVSNPYFKSRLALHVKWSKL